MCFPFIIESTEEKNKSKINTNGDIIASRNHVGTLCKSFNLKCIKGVSDLKILTFENTYTLWSRSSIKQGFSLVVLTVNKNIEHLQPHFFKYSKLKLLTIFVKNTNNHIVINILYN